MSDSEHDSDPGFLARWSERKHAAREGRSLPEAPAETSTKPAADEASSPSAPPAPPPDLPDVDSLDEHSDYSVFLSEGVGEELRRLALRKLFHSPGFNVTDGLDDYADDFRNFKALGDIVTADMKHAIEMAEERRRRAEAERRAAEERLAGDAAPEAPVAASSGDADEGAPEVLAEADSDTARKSPIDVDVNDEESDFHHG